MDQVMRAAVAAYASWAPDRQASFVGSLDEDELHQFEVLSETLLEFIPRVSPGLVAPHHLAPLAELLESTEVEPQQATVSAPPQHGKSQICQHALIRLLLRDPRKRHAYATYETTFAESQNEELQRIADRARLVWDGNRTAWRTPEGGGVVAAGIGGPLTGKPVDGVLLVDDPVKNAVDANSSTMRERAEEWFNTVAFTRCHPSASKIVVQTRWHPDDLSGRINKRKGWKHLNLPAINPETGEALWPQGRPLEFLLNARANVGEYNWSALYMGTPRPRGGTLFQDDILYTELPSLQSFSISIGVDLAYSKKTHSDYSVAVVLMRVNDPRDAKIRPRYFVLEVVRAQASATQFKNELRKLRTKYPRAGMRWYAAGVEKGVADFIQQDDGDLKGVPLVAMTPLGDKFSRAQPVSAAWNDGRVAILSTASWADKFIEELCTFTGVNDAHDDQVDALAAAYDELQHSWVGAGDLSKYSGPTARFSGDDSKGLSPSGSDWNRPSGHANDLDRKKTTGRW
jgi:predicted phage terminase large subunit-like protein